MAEQPRKLEIATSWRDAKIKAFKPATKQASISPRESVVRIHAIVLRSHAFKAVSRGDRRRSGLSPIYNKSMIPGTLL
jgi:hypothetical protein